MIIFSIPALTTVAPAPNLSILLPVIQKIKSYPAVNVENYFTKNAQIGKNPPQTGGEIPGIVNLVYKEPKAWQMHGILT